MASVAWAAIKIKLDISLDNLCQLCSIEVVLPGVVITVS